MLSSEVNFQTISHSECTLAPVKIYKSAQVSDHYYTIVYIIFYNMIYQPVRLDRFLMILMIIIYF